MNRFKNILLYHDSETSARITLKRTVELARRNGAQLTVVDVIEEPSFFSKMLLTTSSKKDLDKLVQEKKAKHLDKVLAFAEKEGMSGHAKLLFGTPFIEIIREVLRNDYDLVVKTAQGRGGSRTALFGSTAMHLIRKCPCPVWVMNPTQKRKYVRILAAVDPESGDPVRESLNTKIMDLATSQARLDQSRLHVVHVWSVYGETVLTSGRSKVPKEEFGQLIDRIRTVHQQGLDGLLGRYDLADIDHQVHMLRGKPEGLIPEVAKRKRIDFTIMGTVCRTGVSGFLIGNTAEKVLQQIDCSILAVKPDGFVTPVKLENA
jgi:universal stress protein E